MFNTRDNEAAYVGMWVSDDSGIYEVTHIGDPLIDLVELDIHDDGSYVKIKESRGHRHLTRSEFRKLLYV